MTPQEGVTPAQAGPRSRWLVAIDGGDGSGKSTLAEKLLAALTAAGAPARLLRIDDFRRPVDWSRTDRAELDLYYDEYYDLAALERCLRAFVEGAPVLEYAVADLQRPDVTANQRLDVGGVQVLLVEGVFVRRLPTVVAHATVIDVQIDPPEARRRILARDLAKGRSEDDVKHRMDARYFPAQERYRAWLGPTATPDAVVDSSRAGATRLTTLREERVPSAVAQALRKITIAPSR